VRVGAPGRRWAWFSATVGALFVASGLFVMVRGGPDVMSVLQTLFFAGVAAIGVRTLRRGRRLRLDRAGVWPAVGGLVPWADVEELAAEDDVLVLRLRDHEAFLGSLGPRALARLAPLLVVRGPGEVQEGTGGGDRRAAAAELARRRRVGGAEFRWEAEVLDRPLEEIVAAARRLAADRA
jgi:hypothetical protein